MITSKNNEKSNAILYNYGYLDSKQNIFTDTINGVTLKNYGTISYKNHLGIYDFNHNKVLYNFENKGVIFRDIDDKFHQNNKEQKFNNYGIFFTDTQNDAYIGFDEGYEVRGAILDKENLNLLNGGEGKNGDKTVKDMSNETVISDTTINGADNLFINNKSLKLDLGNKIVGKTITAISQKKGNVILSNDTDGDIVSGNLDLTLKDTKIIGYFEEEGTLLKVDGDLTLQGDTIINAIAKRDEYGEFLVNPKNVIAVDVEGNLKYDKNKTQIYGEIKGGKESKITINGEENPNNELHANELNEMFDTKGNLYLNGEKWTKGENGNIHLDNGTVHIDNGNDTLIGYLTKDGDTTKAGDNILNTTLDGMITGKDTLNVDKIRFDMGDLKINDLEDTFIINGNKDIHVENAIDKIDTSVIFNKEIKDGNVVSTFKSAEEMGIHDPAKQKLYNELIKNYGKDAETDEIIDKETVEKIANLVGGIDKLIELMATSGVKITRDIAGAFTDSVNEFDKKASKGEWLTNAKYIGSDMEYDGTSTVNGYESDINSMVGMAEYGISDNTSLRFALGGGDTDIDLKELNGKSTSLDGHNYYAGIYAKHSVNGFDMTGSFGYTISDLDVENGGSADSEAFTLAGYIKRDISLTDTIKLQPNVAFAYDYIKQDTAEMEKGMSINSGDYHIFEADMGMNIVKEIAFEKGNLELKAGIKYSMTNVDRNKEITGKYYAADVNLGSPEIDDKKGTAHIGFDYEHETGFGVNGKYETMWSNSGDDSRITAGYLTDFN